MFKGKIMVTYTKDWSVDLAQKLNSQISFIYTQNISPTTVVDLMKISKVKENDKLTSKNLKGKKSEISKEEILNFLHTYSQLSEVECIDETQNHLIFKIITQMNTLSNNQFFVKHSCFQIGSINMKNTSEIWEFFTPHKKNIKRLVKELESSQTRRVEILSITSYDLTTHSLTQKQYDTIHFLFQRGYFEQPKKITLEEASLILKTSPTNIQKHLAKALHKICYEFFNKN